MAVKGKNDEVEWDLDWNDLTEGVPATPPPAPSPAPSLATRAFPTPAAALPGQEPEPVVPPQRLPAIAAPPSLAVAPPPAPAGPPRGLVRGQRVRLAEVLPGDPPPPFEAVLTLSASPGVTLDLCCFGLDEAGRLSDDRYFVFYNQKSSPEGGLSVQDNVFRVDLNRLPAAVRRLAFVATIDGVGTVRALGPSHFELRAAAGSVAARYEFSGGDLEEVKALMIADVYFKDGWRLAAVGQGFAGGLSELLRHFGGQEV